MTRPKRISTTNQVVATTEAQTSTNSLNEIHQLQVIVDEKSGEAKLLRDKVASLERLLSSERQAKLVQEKRHKDDVTQREVELRKTIDICKDRLEFKDAELQEAYSVIKSLESKNSANRSRNCAFATDFSQKKLKTAKPESPQIPKKKTPEVATLKSKISLLYRESHLIKHICKGNFIPLSEHCHFYKLCSFFMQYNRSSCGEVLCTTQRLLSANKEDSVVEDVEIIIYSALCSLVTLSGVGVQGCEHSRCCCAGFLSDLGNQSTTACNIFRVLLVLFKSPQAPSEFLVRQTLQVATHCFESTQLQGEVLRLVLALVQLTPDHTVMFLPFATKLRPSRDLLNNDSVFQFFCFCVHQQEIVENLLIRAEGDSPFIIQICLMFLNDKDEERICIIAPKIIQLIRSLIVNCVLIINREQCGPDIFHVICLILSKLLTKQKTRLLNQCLYCLYICVTSLGYDPELSGRVHQALFWKAKEFLDVQPKRLWSEELMKTLLQETESTGQC